MDRAAKNYQDNKNRKRTVPDLSDAQTRTLVELLAASASFGEIERKLNIGQIDLDIYMNRLGIESAEDAKIRLLQLKSNDEDAEAAILVAREKARAAHLEAEKRLDASVDRLDDLARQVAADARQTAHDRQNAAKDEDAARQRKFAENKSKAGDLLAQYRSPSNRYVGTSVRVVRPNEDSKFPVALDTSVFRQMLLHKGLGFVRDQYNVTDNDIRIEMKSRNISLEFELLPR